jgi:spermidine/putrescine transport system ATP-binding protein
VSPSADRFGKTPFDLTPAELDTPAVELTNVHRRFGKVTALAEINLSVRRGEFLSLLGPSGCGKTTLLRLIAGLDLPDEGNIRIDGTDATGTPAHQRPVNTVFQSYALFPHLIVRENIAFGLRMKKLARPEIHRRVARIMEITQISELADRQPSQLSGGQKQRVALARAIVNEPQVLLLDEPLGALDLQLRKQLQLELHNLQRQLGMTFIYVTHDQEEALALSDRVAVMNAGRIEQSGSARDIYERPRTRFAAQFLGLCNLIEATAQRRDDGVIWADTALGELQVPVERMEHKINGGDARILAIRPEKVRLLLVPEAQTPNCFAAKISDLIYLGSETQYALEAGGVSLHARALNAQADEQCLRVGQNVSVQLPPSALTFLDD